MKFAIHIHVIGLFLIVILASSHCSDSNPIELQNRNTESEDPLFTLMNPSKTGIHFENTLTEGINTNVLMYEYFYNGGGVAAADFNGDDLIDIYFTSNMAQNKFYLNQGDFKFKDIV